MASDLVKVKDTKVLKAPPQSAEAEEALLGAILKNPDYALNKVVDLIDVNCFYQPAHKYIYEAVLELLNRSAIDIYTVSEKLKENGKLEAVGGRAYINSLVLNSVTTANVKYYAEIVKNKAIKRSLITAGSEITDMGYQDESIDSALDKAEKLIFNIAQNKSAEGLIPIDALLNSTYKKIEERFNNRDELLGVTTGFSELDEMTSGFQPSDLIILAARPSVGKTSLALNMAANVALKAKMPVAIFSLEMPMEQLVTRLLCSEAEVDMQKLKTGHMQPKDWEKLLNAMETFAEAPIYIYDNAGCSVIDIRANCRRLAMEKGQIGLVVIDYLQLLEGSSSSKDDAVQQVSENSRGLKMLARDLNAPVMALSQLSRAVEQRQDKKPVLADLRQSGAIEQDADLVMFIYREEYYNQDEDTNKGKAEIIIAKHRNGPIGSVPLLFQSNITKFKNRIKTDVF